MRATDNWFDHRHQFTGAVQSAVDSLRFIMAGVQTKPVDPTDEDAAKATARLGEIVARVESEPAGITAAATHLVEMLLETATPLRDDQAQGIADACIALGVSRTLTERLAPSTDRGTRRVDDT